MLAAADAGVIADEPSTSSTKDEFGSSRDQPTSLSRYVAGVWNNLRKSRSLSDVEMQFQATEYRDEMTMDSLIQGKETVQLQYCMQSNLTLNKNPI